MIAEAKNGHACRTKCVGACQQHCPEPTTHDYMIEVFRRDGKLEHRVHKLDSNGQTKEERLSEREATVAALTVSAGSPAEALARALAFPWSKRGTFNDLRNAHSLRCRQFSCGHWSIDVLDIKDSDYPAIG
jgi:hypothetical protein